MSQTTPPLGGRYELRRQLASGPAARVYLAQDLELGRPVAVKVLGPDLARDPEIVDRFRQAANTAASVHDPRIVTIYDWGDDQGAVYVAMELVDGRRASPRRCATPQRLGIDRTVNMGIGVAQALDAAHRSGLVHGSLTPRDVLMAQDSTVKVTDFGTATAGLASLGDPIANALYQSPEQLQGRPADSRQRPLRARRDPVRGGDRRAAVHRLRRVRNHATQADGSPDSTVDVHHGNPSRVRRDRRAPARSGPGPPVHQRRRGGRRAAPAR